jgi:hypothetical protein
LVLFLQTKNRFLNERPDMHQTPEQQENQATICRVTCGWKLPHLDLAVVRPYWRDAHSPGIARRPGIYEYRHYPLDPPIALFGNVQGIDSDCPDDARLMWLSDVRYADQAGLDEFSAHPGPYERSKLLGDIDMIVDRSTTYRVLGANGDTLRDATGWPAPAGPARSPIFQVFFRARLELETFRAALRGIAARWAASDGVQRVRLSLFEIPDLEAERKAGYPIKTHPPEQQYQGWIDLVIDSEAVAAGLLTPDDAAQIATVHAYPAPAVYTFNHAGRPTLAGLRGYPAVKAIAELGATHQKDGQLLHWMYGDVADGVAL